LFNNISVSSKGGGGGGIDEDGAEEEEEEEEKPVQKEKAPSKPANKVRPNGNLRSKIL
jgi:hypothetical protein